MTRWWFMPEGGGEPTSLDREPKPIEAAERLRCLVCGSSGPFSSLEPSGMYAIRDGKLIGETNSVRVSCQRCAGQFTMSVEGSFQHHPAAQPYTGDARPGASRTAAQPDAEPQRDPGPPRPQWPEARKPPPV